MRILVEFLSCASLISMFASPLFIIKLVIQTKSVEFMPFYLSLSTFLMSTSFLVYGLLNEDPFIYVPNGIGTVLGIIQLVLYFYFESKSREESREPLIVSYAWLVLLKTKGNRFQGAKNKQLLHSFDSVNFFDAITVASVWVARSYSSEPLQSSKFQVSVYVCIHWWSWTMLSNWNIERKNIHSALLLQLFMASKLWSTLAIRKQIPRCKE